MADSRNKGAAFERDVCKRLNTFFADEGIDLSVKRNLDQYQSKDLCDIELPGYAIECKAYKSGWWHLAAWWDQVCQAADSETPVLVWKFNNKPVRGTIPLHYVNDSFDVDNSKTCVVTFDEWLDILKTKDHVFDEVA